MMSLDDFVNLHTYTHTSISNYDCTSFSCTHTTTQNINFVEPKVVILLSQQHKILKIQSLGDLLISHTLIHQSISNAVNMNALA